MRKTFFKSALTVAALLLLWGCGSSSPEEDIIPPGGGTEQPEQPKPPTDDPWVTVDKIPIWTIDWMHNDPQPDWSSPDAGKYENFMIFTVHLPDELQPFISKDDLMAIFIDGEVRALSKMASVFNETDPYTNNNYFILKVFANSSTDSDDEFTISYYNSQLHHLFSIVGLQRYFISEAVASDDTPPFLLGSSKYPVVMNLLLSCTIDQDVEKPFEPAEGDIIGVFVGNECRGLHYVDKHLLNNRITFSVFGKEEGEPVTLRYFSFNKFAVRTIPTNIDIKQGNKMSSITL